MTINPSEEIKMVLSPYARDKFNYENGATKVLSSFLPFEEHSPEKVVMGFHTSVTSNAHYVTLTISKGKVLINGTVIIMDEDFTKTFERVAYDKKLYVMITSNKYDDRMGHAEIVIVDEDHKDEYTYNHVLLTTLTVTVTGEPILEDDRHCRIGLIDESLAKHLGYSFRDNNVFKTRNDLRFKELSDNEYYVLDGFIHKIPVEYNFSEPNNTDTFIIGNDEQIVKTGLIYPNGFKKSEPINYFDKTALEITHLIDDDFNNIYLGTDGELWQRTFDLVIVGANENVEDGILIRRNRDGMIQNVKYAKTVDEVKLEKNIPLTSVDGNISGNFLIESDEPIFDLQYNHTKVKSELSHLAINKTAIFITSTLSGVHIPIYVSEFTTITKSMLTDTITEELIEFENWNVKLWVNKNRFTGSYKSILSSVIIDGNNVLTLSTKDLSPDCVLFDENNVIISNITKDTLNSMIDSGFAKAYDLGCEMILT